jgi:hypothetical protein
MATYRQLMLLQAVLKEVYPMLVIIEDENIHRFSLSRN